MPCLCLSKSTLQNHISVKMSDLRLRSSQGKERTVNVLNLTVNSTFLSKPWCLGSARDQTTWHIDNSVGYHGIEPRC